MEARLSTLEGNMEKINQSLQDVLHRVCNMGPTTDGLPEQAAPGTSSYRVSDETRAGMETLQWQQPTSIPDLPDFSSATAMGPSAPSPPFGVQRLNTMENGLPSEEIMRDLVALFFDMVHPWLPLFHQSTFVEKMFLPERDVLLHAILVISFRFWQKPIPSPEVRESYVKGSRDHLLLKTIDTCSLVSTQALALMALDAIGQGTGPKTWNTMSMLVCAAKHLGLQDRDKSTPPYRDTTTALVRNEDSNDEITMSSVEAEERSRLFWVIYNLDRFSSVSHGQPGGIISKYIRVPYPTNEAEFSPVTAQEWFHYIPSVNPQHSHCLNRLWHSNIDLLALMDRSNQLLIQPVNLSIPAHCQEWKASFRRLDMTLSAWFQRLPREDREPPAIFDPMWVMVHATFHLIRTRLFTVAAFPSTTSPYLRPSATARGSCRQTISDISSLAASLKPHELDHLGPMFAFVIWVASRSLLILWTTGYEKSYESVPAELETFIATLRSLAVRWPCAQRYSDIIQLVLDNKNNAGGAPILDIFNDTRRTAYGLQDRLGPMSSHLFTEYLPPSFDFLDVSGLNVDTIDGPWNVGDFPCELNDEWL